MLYARYLDSTKTKRMMAWAGPLKPKRVLDACGGGGEITLAAIEDAALVVYVDQEEKMLSPRLKGIRREAAARGYTGEVPRNLMFSIEPIQLFLSSPPPNFTTGLGGFDVVFCQQAINYWLNPETAKQLAALMKSGGVFIFNTFANRPPKEPFVRQYGLNGRHYVETSWMVEDDMVHHVQVASGLSPHTTIFKWMSADTLKTILSPHFHVTYKKMDQALYVKCTKI
jgi:SAM-dependent methyltransferase